MKSIPNTRIAVTFLVLASTLAMAAQKPRYEIPHAATDAPFPAAQRTAKKKYEERLHGISRQAEYLETLLAVAPSNQDLLVIRLALDAERHDAEVDYQSRLIAVLTDELTRIQKAHQKVLVEIDPQFLAEQRRQLQADIHDLRLQAESALSRESPQQSEEILRFVRHLLAELEQLEETARTAQDLSAAIDGKIEEFGKKKQSYELIRRLHRAQRNAKAVDVLQREYRRALEDLHRHLDQHLTIKSEGASGTTTNQ